MHCAGLMRVFGRLVKVLQLGGAQVSAWDALPGWASQGWKDNLGKDGAMGAGMVLRGHRWLSTLGWKWHQSRSVADGACKKDRNRGGKWW